MSEEAFAALVSEIGDEIPESMRSLSPDELRDLAAAVHDARRRQAKALAEAGERALGHIPRLLRGPVRKIVG